MRNVSPKSRRAAQEVLGGDPGSENRITSGASLPAESQPRHQSETATGPEVHINNPDWLAVLGSATLPVHSFTPKSIVRAVDGQRVECYFVALERLSDVQRGGLIVGLQALTGRLNVWSEAQEFGLPIPCSDCCPILG